MQRRCEANFQKNGKQQLGQQLNAGFWVRLCAFWIDSLIVWGVVMLVVLTARKSLIYVPAEISIIIFGAFYWILLTSWRGKTVGKSLCGLKVLANNGFPPSFARTVLREFIGKLASATVFLGGFIWIAFSKSKLAWHDTIAQTKVVQDPAKSGRARVLLTIVLLISVILVNPIKWAADYSACRRMSVEIDKVVTAYSQRDPSNLVEVSSLEPDDLAPFVKWIDENSKDPLKYAVETAAGHQITIFGELHGQQDNLAFFNKIIPDLYHRAGVTCVALEVCIPEDNVRLAKLVTSREYDSELALKIARNGDSWKNWGWKGYWDVLETVWRVNKDLPPDKKKMRVVGLGIKFDGPSVAMAGMGEFTVPGPAWEKLRIFTFFDDFAKTIMSDGLYAANVSRETIEKGERGVVLVGAAHSRIKQLWPHGNGNKLNRERARMGFLLHEKYGDQVFQILFHNQIILSSKFIRFIERVNSERKHSPFGCDLENSPFGTLRDSTDNHFRLQPGLCLSDIATGYIYLKPFDQQKRCEWLKGYISEDMFEKHKKYYEAKTGKRLNKPEEVDEAFSNYNGW